MSRSLRCFLIIILTLIPLGWLAFKHASTSKPLGKPWRDNTEARPDAIHCQSNYIDEFVSYDGYDTLRRMEIIYETLKTCNNITSLSLSVSQGGCGWADNLWSFPFKNGDRFASHLSELTIRGYQWDDRPNTPWRSITLSSAESWKAAMDWSKLKRLSIDLPPNSFLEAFHGQLIGLESFRLGPMFGRWGDNETLCSSFDRNADQMRANYTSFIIAMPPLRELRIGGTGDLLDLVPILNTHGNNLRHFSHHDYERDCSDDLFGFNAWSRPTLSPIALQDLNGAAPYLESLELDTHREYKEWPHPTFKALSNYRNLRNLTLHFDLDDPTRQHPTEMCAMKRSAGLCFQPELMQPILTVDGLKDIFHTLRDDESHEGTLQYLNAYVGDYARQVGGGLRVDAHYEQNTPQRFACYIGKKGLDICDAFEMHNDPWDLGQMEKKVATTLPDFDGNFGADALGCALMLQQASLALLGKQ